MCVPSLMRMQAHFEVLLSSAIAGDNNTCAFLTASVLSNKRVSYSGHMLRNRGLPGLLQGNANTCDWLCVRARGCRAGQAV